MRYLKHLTLVSLMNVFMMQTIQAMPIPSSQSVFSRINYTLALEDWIPVTSAEVAVTLTTTAKLSESDRSNDSQYLNQITKGEWHIVSQVRNETQTGMLTTTTKAIVRLPLDTVSGLNKIIKQLNTQEGLSVKLTQVDYAPTPDEREAVMQALRTKAYEKIKAEMARVKVAYPNSTFMIDRISFNTDKPVRPQARMLAQAPASDATEMAAGIPSSEKINVNVYVVIMSPVANGEKDD